MIANDNLTTLHNSFVMVIVDNDIVKHFKLNFIPMTEKENVSKPNLGMKVFHETIYNGKELMKVVGIRESEAELEGDYSGGTQPVTQKSWLPIGGLFRLIKVCEQVEKFGSCQLHNVHCGFPNCHPYVDINENKI